MDWIFHLDTDELIYPAGTREYSVRELLSAIPADTDMVIFPNYVSNLHSLTFLLLLGVKLYANILSCYQFIIFHFLPLLVVDLLADERNLFRRAVLRGTT